MPPAPITVRWLGRRPYAETWRLQHALVAAIADGTTPDTLLLVEHEPVITLGRRKGAEANVLDAGPLPVLHVERGGDATYHGPGQLVGYPLLRLVEGDRDLHLHLRRVEGVLIELLAGCGLAAGRLDGQTGVWVQDRKLASVGVAVRRWVTYHGFALNVSTDMAPFSRLHPCGLPSAVMASMEELLPAPVPSVAELAARLSAAFPPAFGRVAIPPEALPPLPEGPPCPTILAPNPI